MTTDQKIETLRKEMKAHNIAATIIPTNDPHQSEYPVSRWGGREWISGFTGSAGTVIITHDDAGLWTDGRYYFQGEQQLSNSSMKLFKYGLADVPSYNQWLTQNLNDGDNVSISGEVCSIGQLESLEKELGSSGINVITKYDLLSNIWEDQPLIPKNSIVGHDIKYNGETRSSKLDRIRASMRVQKVDHHLINTLDDLAWIFNIRGTDVEFNPVVTGYAIISLREAVFYTLPEKLSSELTQKLINQGIIIKPYLEVVGDLNNFPEMDTILIDPSNTSVIHFHAINCKVVRGKTISRLMKAVKNKTEISHTKETMVKDGIALANAFYKLEQILKSGKTCSEAEFSDIIAESRSMQANYIGESFPAIVGYKGNGAIIHYRPLHGLSDEIKPEGVLLVDSGGQYETGTTDITRTISLSTPTSEVKRNFTLVLKGHIELARAKFPEGTSGGQLDVLARKHLWNHGLNYGHGTGHGVGFYLNVHEPPQSISPPKTAKANVALLPGMYTSNEPGYYKEGSYGIRIENLVFTKKSKIEGFLEFESVTLYPFDLKMIDENIITKTEKAWLNKYHNKVLKAIGPHLNGDIKTWFELKCRGMN